MTGRFINLLLPALLLIVSITPAEATTRECKASQAALDTVRESLVNVRREADAIEALAAGRGSTDLSTDQLEDLLTAGANQKPIVTLPESVRCVSLKDAYTNTRNNLIEQQQRLQELQNTYWSKQPRVVKAAFQSVWRSRQRLLQHQQSIVENFRDEPSADWINLLDNLNSRQQAQRLAFFRLLPTLSQATTPTTIAAWLQLWLQSIQLAQQPFSADPQQLASLSKLQRKLVEDHFRIALLDALVMTNVINNVRAWYWQSSSVPFQQALSDLELSRKTLIYNEALSIRHILVWLYVDAVVDFRPDNKDDAVIWRLFYGFEYLFGIAAFFLLAWLAKKLKTITSSLQATVARRRTRSRLTTQMLRTMSVCSTLLPWVVGWFGLAWLEIAFKDYQLVLLIPLIPFGRLYIIYGLTRLLGEWFVGRINERAGQFLAPQQVHKIRRQTQISAAMAMLPLLLHDIANLAIGPSLLLILLLWMVLVSGFLALSFLLLPWRSTFILALQSLLPEPVDPWVERILNQRLYPLLSPVISPLLLLAVFISFLHRGMVDMDWYRKLIARSFKLRSSLPEQENAPASDEDALREYKHWFGYAPANVELPFIKVEALQRIQHCLEPWLEKQSDENTLLLYGERGSGKTTLLQRTQEWLSKNHPTLQVHSVTVAPKTHTAAAVTQLLENVLSVELSDGPASLVKTDNDRQPTVVILENAQNFFLRKVGALEGWESLLSFTKARVANIFWVIAINNQSWAYLSHVFGGDYQFSTVLKTRPWSQNEIRSLILSRNQLSGFSLRYDDILLSTRGPEAGSVRNAEQLYFSLLWDSCRGNPLLGLAMWLTSVTVKGKTVTVGLPAEMSATALEHLGDELHFVYAALLIHENLSSEELVAATSLTQGIVRAALKTAFDAGFVERSADRRYRIMPLWYPTLSKLLSRKNLLHE